MENRTTNGENAASWPEVDVPRGWKKNPAVARKVAWIALLTLLIAGTMIVLTAGRSDFLPMVFFLVLVLLPVIGRWGQGSNYREARELHTVAEKDVNLAETAGGWQVTRCRVPYQKLDFPRTLAGKPLLSMREGLFAGNRVLAYVHLPQDLTEISDRLFERCDNLPAVMLPAGVRRIGGRAFSGCTALRDVYIPFAVTQIAPDAFQGCRDLILHVREGSAAEQFAREQDILYSFR